MLFHMSHLMWLARISRSQSSRLLGFKGRFLDGYTGLDSTWKPMLRASPIFWGPNGMRWIWVNYNNSQTWIKAIWGWFPLLTMIIVRSQWGRYNLPRWINPRSVWFFAFITLPSSGCSAAVSPAAMGISMSRASDTFAMGARSIREENAAIGGNAGGTWGGSLKMPEVEMNQNLHV